MSAPTAPTFPVQADPDSLERATVQAVSPERLDDTLPGWLLPMDHGTVGRARCAVPLSHDGADPAVVPQVVQRYTDAGFVPAWRLPDLPGFDALGAALRAEGWRCEQPTLTQVAPLVPLRALAEPVDVVLRPQADADWLTMFLGEGLDPVDGAHRSRALARASGTLFVSALRDGATVACGAASLSHGWLGVHGMRTAAAWRGRGLAAQVMTAMARAAAERGIHRTFLQVDAGNAAAQSLYRRAGYVTAWRYAYWRR